MFEANAVRSIVVVVAIEGESHVDSFVSDSPHETMIGETSALIVKLKEQLSFFPL